MNKKFLLLCLLFSFSQFFAACAAANDSQEARTSLVKKADPEPIAVNKKRDGKEVHEIKKTALSVDGIYDVAVVKGKKNDCLVAFKVRHLKRFQMKKIERQLKEKLEKKFSGLTFTVSSDFKIFLEAVRLNERIKKENLSEEQKEKRLQEIIRLSREKT